MTKEEINEFSVRISQCTRVELVAITCEIITNYIESAKAAYDKENREGFIFNIKKAMDFVDNLSGSLDMDYKISENLLSLYVYVKRSLIRANARIVTNELDEVASIIRRIGEAFENVSKQEIPSEKVMNPGQEIYAGYTYGKDLKLNEYVVKK